MNIFRRVTPVRSTPTEPTQGHRTSGTERTSSRHRRPTDLSTRHSGPQAAPPTPSSRPPRTALPAPGGSSDRSGSAANGEPSSLNQDNINALTRVNQAANELEIAKSKLKLARDTSSVLNPKLLERTHRRGHMATREHNFRSVVNDRDAQQALRRTPQDPAHQIGLQRVEIGSAESKLRDGGLWFAVRHPNHRRKIRGDLETARKGLKEKLNPSPPQE
jgi:hypothetical protein